MKNATTTHISKIKEPLSIIHHPSSIPLLLAGALGLALASGTLAGGGNQGNPRILPPQSYAYGHSYGQWSEAWFQWCFSMPVTHNPIFDTADISAGQAGPVWFLGGNFTGTPVTRTGIVPAGTTLFFPILNNWADNTDCSNGQMISDNNTEAFLRSFVAGQANQAQNVSCTIDGVPVAGLTDPINTPYRAPSATPGGFSYTLPATDNVLDFLGLTCWSDTTGTPLPVSAAIYHPVADGVYLMLSPLTRESIPSTATATLEPSSRTTPITSRCSNSAAHDSKMERCKFGPLLSKQTNKATTNQANVLEQKET